MVIVQTFDKYFLSSTSKGFRHGEAIPNFGDSSNGLPISNPDVGAFDDRMTAGPVASALGNWNIPAQPVSSTFRPTPRFYF